MVSVSVLQYWAQKALMARSMEEKSTLIEHMGRSPQGPASAGIAPIKIEQPGYPDSLTFVHPRSLKQRRLSTEEGRACFLHAIAHIEFNAVNLALDAIYRFRHLPVDYYKDWLRVAAEEVCHHQLLIERMRELGFEYGDFPVHKGLWDIANMSDENLMIRMALVPCVLEARGLDVTPSMIEKLVAVGDQKSASVLQVILDQEVDHVAIGIRWYTFACQSENVDPVDRFIELLEANLPNRVHGPFNIQQRVEAGFTAEWLARLS